MPKPKKFKIIISSLFTVILSVLIIYGIVQAGSLTPSALPAATSYTLTDIYTRLTTNVAATEANHLFTPSGVPAATLYTLKQIYDAIPTILNDRVLSGTSYLGVAGTYNISNLNPNMVATSTAFGTSSVGTLLGHEWNGSAGALVSDYTYYPLNNFSSLVGASNTVLGFFGGVDDYNNNETMPTDSYVGAGWYGLAGSCNLGNHYCGAGDTAVSADNKDLSTGLVWSKTAGYLNWFGINNCYQPLTPTYNPADCQGNGDIGCRCIKKPAGSKVGCEALDGGGIWRSPTQKELLQAYIDGSKKYLSAVVSGWVFSATTVSDRTHYAYFIDLGFGVSYGIGKGSAVYFICVH